ncbi:hypothetical protein [Rhizobium multihospitium]|uniref:hypothetical protein n=1 Tax=Rhizobium multihospitium TaxID=410764 RepID=UPI00142D2457|nr:hypothetical protein [Rhizobium multihospitium]
MTAGPRDAFIEWSPQGLQARPSRLDTLKDLRVALRVDEELMNAACSRANVSKEVLKAFDPAIGKGDDTLVDEGGDVFHRVKESWGSHSRNLSAALKALSV